MADDHHKLCLTLAEPSIARLEEKLRQYGGRAAMIEVRLDYLASSQPPRLPADTGTEFIATCRPEREGGRFRGSESSRLEILRNSAAAGFDWIDLEHDVQAPGLPASVRIVRSLHRHESFPQDLPGLLARLGTRPGDVKKLAVNVATTQELATLLRWMEQPAEDRVVLGMGTFGQPSRVLGAFLGNSWTYVSEEPSRAVAEGQFSFHQAVYWYRLNQWNEPPDLYGVIGNPVAHSRSPLLHNQLFQYYDHRGLYCPLPVSHLDPWFSFLQESLLPFRGFSVTLPFKVEVRRYVEERDQLPWSVNTLISKHRKWWGSNTDYPGFLRPLRARNYSVKGRTALVLGNGGVAHTVVAALLAEGSRVIVAGRDAHRVSQFAAAYGCAWCTLNDLPTPADLCINTTPIGQFPHVEESPLQENQIDFELVYDLVYSPENTRLLEWSRRKGALTIPGREMFIEQAALQFQLWTGVDPDRQLMRETLAQRE